MKILFDPTTHANMELVKNPESRKDPVNTVSSGVAGLVWMLFGKSDKKMPSEVLVMSAVILMCHVFDFLERSFKVPVTNDIVAATTKKLGENLFEKLGVTPEQLNEKIAAGYGEIQQHLAGTGAAPRAPTPNPGAV